VPFASDVGAEARVRTLVSGWEAAQRMSGQVDWHRRFGWRRKPGARAQI